MAAVPGQTVQELFKSLDQPFCHFLVWYLVVVLSIEIKDIAEVLICPEESRWRCSISLQFEEITLVIESRSGEYSVVERERKPSGKS